MNRKQVSWKVDLACGISTLLLFSGVLQCSGIETNVIDCAKEREKAIKGDAEAQFNSALCCYMQTNYTDMLHWFRKAAEQGHRKALINLGGFYLRGEGMPKDAREAIKWYRRAAEQGDAFAQQMMGDFYHTGEHLPKDDHEAFKWYCKAAEQGDSLGESMLELLFMEHWQNSAEIAKWLLSDNPTLRGCQRMLGSLYERGEGVPRDEVKALKWYRKAAEQGHVTAEWSVGRFYEEGKGTAKNPAEAAKWYRKAADQGDNSSQMALANLYAEGRGIPLDGLKAIEWYQKAAEKGFNNLALVAIAEIWAFGKGVPKNVSQAIKSYKKALEARGYLSQELAAESEFNLGVFFFNGDGVPVDYIEAYKWFNLAAANGEAKAVELRNSLTRLMTREQVAEAQLRASEFLGRKQSGNQPGGGSSPAEPSIATPKASGSGSFITEDGYLLTNAHVVEDAVRLVVKTKLGALSAKLVKADLVNDIAVLKVSGVFGALPIVPSRAVKLGESVITVGFPNPGLQGVEPKLTDGKISSLSGVQDDARHFQISVAVQPGNSGGALVNSVGNVVGIVTARLSDMAALKTSGALPQNVNYAIKSSYVLSLLESLPEVAGKLKEPSPAKERKFEDVVKDTQEAAALILVY